jgi:hypothetical protein
MPSIANVFVYNNMFTSSKHGGRHRRLNRSQSRDKDSLLSIYGSLRPNNSLICMEPYQNQEQRQVIFQNPSPKVILN